MEIGNIGSIGELVGGNVFEELVVAQDGLVPVYLKLNTGSGSLGTSMLKFENGSEVVARPFVVEGTATFIGNGSLRCVRIALHSARKFFDTKQQKPVLTAPQLFRRQEWRCKKCRTTVVSGLTGAEYTQVQKAWLALRQGKSLNAVMGKNGAGQDILAPSLVCPACQHDHSTLKQDGRLINLAPCESTKAKYEPECRNIDQLRAGAVEAGPVCLASYGVFKAGMAPGVWHPTTSAAQVFDQKVRAAGFEARPLDELMKLPVLTNLAGVIKPIAACQFGLADPAQLSCKNGAARANVADYTVVGA